MNLVEKAYKGLSDTVRKLTFKGRNYFIDGFRREEGFHRVLNPSDDFILDEAYKLNPYVWIVTNRIAEECSHMPIKFVDENTGGDIDFNDLPDDFKKYWKNPNREQDYYRFVKNAILNYLITADTFVFFDKVDIANRMVDYSFEIPVSPQVQITPSDNSEVVTGYLINYYNRTITKSYEEVFHLSNDDITEDSKRGLSVLQGGGINVWRVNNLLWRAFGWLMNNKGTAGILYGKGNQTQTPSEKKQRQKALDEDITRVDNYHKIKYFGQELGYIKLGLDGQSLNVFKYDAEQQKTIAAMFNYPATLAFDISSAKYNNLEQARESALLDSVIPYTNKFISSYSKYLFKVLGDASTRNIKAVVNIEEVELLKQKKVEEVNSKVETLYAEKDQIAKDLNAGLIEITEARRRINGINGEVDALRGRDSN